MNLSETCLTYFFLAELSDVISIRSAAPSLNPASATLQLHDLSLYLCDPCAREPGPSKPRKWDAHDKKLTLTAGDQFAHHDKAPLRFSIPSFEVELAERVNAVKLLPFGDR
jgi:hypothetical protein